jgi:hypothetical protein
MRQGRRKDWDGEELLILLKSLGDDWYQEHSGRWDKTATCPFKVTFKKKVVPWQDPDLQVPALRVYYPMFSRARLFEIIPAWSPRSELPKPEVKISLDWVEDDLKDVPSQADPDDVDTSILKVGRLWTMRVRKEEVDYDVRHRTRLETTRVINNAHIEGHLPVRESSHWIRHTDVMLVDGHDLSPAVISYATGFRFGEVNDVEYAITRVQSVCYSLRPGSRANHTRKAFLADPGWLDL